MVAVGGGRNVRREMSPAGAKNQTELADSLGSGTLLKSDTYPTPAPPGPTRSVTVLSPPVP